jgi:hypothetical protein
MKILDKLMEDSSYFMRNSTVDLGDALRYGPFISIEKTTNYETDEIEYHLKTVDKELLILDGYGFVIGSGKIGSFCTSIEYSSKYDGRCWSD